MPIPTEVVGSLPRPSWLQQAFGDYDQGKITYEELQKYQDKACEDSIQLMVAAGEPVVTDGEQRASSFATYPLTDTLGGTGLAKNLVADGQYFAFFDDGHHRQLPRLTGGPFRYKTYASDYLQKSSKGVSAPMKTAVIAPSMLSLLYPLDENLPDYTREQFLSDLCDECEKDVRQAFNAGAVRVSIDFTEGRLASKNDPRNPWTGRNMLKSFVDLNNRVIDRFTPEERKNIGIHTCPGGDCDSVHSFDVPYESLLPSMFKMNVGYFLIQCASEIEKEKVYKLVGDNIRKDANGVKQVSSLMAVRKNKVIKARAKTSQVAFIGVTNPSNPTVETPEQVADALVVASKYISKDQLGATDDCGFSPFSIDSKPKHGSPDYARDIAFMKITARIKGAKIASERLGV
ncbi:cobalamin-independent synthase, catalytic domain-containing protein [Rhizoctonia solani]|uniref:Cobalamin-independent synthase, catalytic domain-containing protein n=1 Tax=Rhizoctonia solani TaxID=456999 RepID=A0A8H8SZR4_9AGAM|nr:cobalamin-independent synthase, catalytic domain-containing protein [Rhizoctonia solani]QRW22678.1 cobalamin-independent synthase, catalytic domain-containing protein [Rhizoctonia solani]